jgi:hypothetical protein
MLTKNNNPPRDATAVRDGAVLSSFFTHTEQPMFKITLYLAILAAALVHSAASAQQGYPSTCDAASQFSLDKQMISSKRITPFTGGAFTMNGLAPGQYTMSTNMPMMIAPSNPAVVGSDGVLSGVISCGGVQYFDFKQTNLAPPPQPIADCSAVNVGKACGEWFKFSASYYSGPNDVGFAAAKPSSYPLVPKCAGVNGLAPATIAAGPSSGCFRRFWVLRAASPQPASQWVPILKKTTWVQNATPLNLSIGDQIAN